LEGIVAWMGVGNVEGVIVRRDGNGGSVCRESLVSRPGVVGSRLPPLIATLLPISEGDTLIFATDGVDANFERSIVRYDPPEAIAKRILANHAKGTDDALVLVARYVG
jgi:negative regulator of sigma-B (phosphoserine phosphatase)